MTDRHRIALLTIARHKACLDGDSYKARMILDTIYEDAISGIEESAAYLNTIPTTEGGMKELTYNTRLDPISPDFDPKTWEG